MTETYRERLEAALKERAKRSPKPKPYRFSVPLKDQTMTVKVEDVQSALTDLSRLQGLVADLQADALLKLSDERLREIFGADDIEQSAKKFDLATENARPQGLVEEAREGLSTLFRWPRVQEHSEFGVGYNVCAEEIGETARSLLAKLEGRNDR